VWLSDTEIALMRETGTQISHNPSSNAKLGNGIARVPEMLAAGINVGIGHDAAECNNSRDMFEVMKFASLIHRASRVEASLQQAPDVVRMATRNGADALGLAAGQLATGKKADVILVNLKSQMFTPLMPENSAHLFSHLVFAANGSAAARRHNGTSSATALALAAPISTSTPKRSTDIANSRRPIRGASNGERAIVAQQKSGG